MDLNSPGIVSTAKVALGQKVHKDVMERLRSQSSNLTNVIRAASRADRKLSPHLFHLLKFAQSVILEQGTL